MGSHISRVKVGWGKGECWGLAESYWKSNVMTWPWCYQVRRDAESWFFCLWDAVHGFPWDSSLETSDGPSFNREPGPTPLLCSSHKTHLHSLHLTVHVEPFFFFPKLFLLLAVLRWGSFPNDPVRLPLTFGPGWETSLFSPCSPKGKTIFPSCDPPLCGWPFSPVSWLEALCRPKFMYKLVEYLCVKKVDHFMKTRLKVFGKFVY